MVAGFPTVLKSAGHCPPVESPGLSACDHNIIAKFLVKTGIKISSKGTCGDVESAIPQKLVGIITFVLSLPCRRKQVAARVEIGSTYVNAGSRKCE
jgi:hypothetical protein